MSLCRRLGSAPAFAAVRLPGSLQCSAASKGFEERADLASLTARDGGNAGFARSKNLPVLGALYGEQIQSLKQTSAQTLGKIVLDAFVQEPTS